MEEDIFEQLVALKLESVLILTLVLECVALKHILSEEHIDKAVGLLAEVLREVWV